MPTYQTVPVTCPNCNNRFASPVLTIIDVGQNPEAKALLLSGQINIAICPQCGAGGMLSAPLVYHDPENELLFTYLPAEMGLPEMEQQRVVGELTNRVMSTLPPEKRKGYLLQPRNFLRLEGMIEAILEADGITPEMMQAQRAKADLLDRLVEADSPDARRAIAQENDDQIDYEFFQLLTLNIEIAQAQGQEQAAQQLLAIRQELLEWTTTGQEAADREEAIRELGTEITREGLLEKLMEAALADEQAKIETMVTVARPAIDYVFYQQLANRIEAASAEGKTQEAAALRALRETILDLTAQIDAEMKKAAEQAAQLIQEIANSGNIEQAVRANLDRIDEMFLSVLAGNIQAAEQSGQAEQTKKLQEIGDILMKLIQESQPPEVRFINQLLGADYPAETQALLEENRQQVDARLLELMQMINNDLVEDGREALAQKLEQIREQAAALTS